MANQEHLSLIKGGTKKWNRWREKNPNIIPDFRNAELSGVNLSGAELSNANMRGTTLVGTNFQDADLSNAELAGADLSGANLRNAILNEAVLDNANLSSSDLSSSDLILATLINANLSGANLIFTDLSDTILLGADLSGADISMACLEGANFTNANLSGTSLSYSVFTNAVLVGADLTRSEIRATVFANNDLSQTKGLDTIIHLGPSSIGVDTIYKSKGKIPESFLINAGIPDNFITYMKSLTGVALEFYSCFISHSSKDTEFVKHLNSKLRDEHVRVWYAPEDLKGGKKLVDQIDEAIRHYDKLLLVLSENSINSEWVKVEILKAKEREKIEKRQKLFPITLMNFETLKKWKYFDSDSGRDLAREVREYFIPDFSNWKNHDSFMKAFDRLLSDLKASEIQEE